MPIVYQDLTTQRPSELWRLPDLSLVGMRQPLGPLPGFLWQSNINFVKFVRQVSSEGARLDIREEISRPTSLGGYATLTPFVAGRLTAYDRTVTGHHDSPQGGVVEETNDDPRLRRLVEAGVDLATNVTRVYSTNGWWGTDALLHTIACAAPFRRSSIVQPWTGWNVRSIWPVTGSRAIRRWWASPFTCWNSPPT